MILSSIRRVSATLIPEEQYGIKKVVERLIRGLKFFLGKKVRAPQEVMKTGRDIAKRIKERMEGLYSE